ncbi:hypothetical protein K504DRAFT_459319 [Pleomassaria siparia CBS 279.74]|uniref:Zn(2)-C6 fungal-type domain-containing protein n=1 Tax=Pleomassaria siparia CBS 279.74 TaxID=1314801 RepID=A0A6G1K305_9PLEO|nr:hypothetical protein K504DRAFT_459319 [Pleomassaria siparia CBS 279.74]
MERIQSNVEQGSGFQSARLEIPARHTRGSRASSISSTGKDGNSTKKKRRGGTRRKTGCSTCKSRHSRCDEKKPICGNCERLNLECVQSDFISHSEFSSGFDTPTPTPTPAPAPAPGDGGSPYFPPPETQASTWDAFRTQMQGLGNHIQGLEMISNNSRPPTDAFTYMNVSTPAGTIDTVSSASTVALTSETAFLLQAYVKTVATWMDLMDHTSTYQLSIPRLILSSPLLFHCICAFTAKHLALANSGQNTFWEPIARQHYGESLRMLIDTLNGSNHGQALTATILMSSYEMVSSAGLEDRRHFLGAMMLIKSQNITARSRGVDRANFWIYVRHEISIALTSEQPLLMDPDGWQVQWEQGETREDVLGNHVLWILARVINLVYGKDNDVEVSSRKREALLQEMEDWRAGLSDNFVGVPYGDEDEDGFKKVYFPVTAAAVAAFWYHVARILLYAEPVLNPFHASQVQDHAIKITNIAMSEFPDSFRVFATHGLYYAAKHIHGLGRKARIWHILNVIEAQLGYHTRSVGKRLQDLLYDQGV